MIGSNVILLTVVFGVITVLWFIKGEDGFENFGWLFLL